MMLHLPARAVLHRALSRIGRIHTARLDFSQLSSKYPLYLAGKNPNIFNPEFATGCLMDLGIYCVYAALDLFGLPDSLEASAGFLPPRGRPASSLPADGWAALCSATLTNWSPSPIPKPAEPARLRNHRG